ncbi:hypothetical protein C8A05DRAFT_39719 [Staphylotrichum tortipilum]|uniref:Uncharacterized protein n=1 Tax=Staphylotrichum tortipilum TaxID=2831512 RepID=A0AAN6RMZ3_9PEZI|nr:hypothetical protein C8A05DRAFT_39719 [Staphylotrichum longicolle]
MSGHGLSSPRAFLKWLKPGGNWVLGTAGLGPAWAVADFFELLKDQLRRLYFVSFSRRRVFADRNLRGERGAATPAVQAIYREHGWPDLERFRRDECLRAVEAALQARFPGIAQNLYVEYFDPFNCECRAYGRLRQEGQAEVAHRAEHHRVPSPGSDADENQLAIDEFWNRHAQHRGLPVRAIVKHLADNRDPTANQARDMWADLQALHSLGIFVRDTHAGNYMGAKLVDFSRAWTMYHPAMDQIAARTAQELLLGEVQKLIEAYCQFDSRADPLAIPPDLEAYGAGKLDQYRNWPWAYRWRKWEEDGDGADEYRKRLFKEPDA